jgi:hypothetical protein
MFNIMKINDIGIAERLKSILDQYIKEIKYLKLYILTVAVFIISCYSVYIFFDVVTVSKLGEEDKFFEWLTFIFFILASAVFIFISFKTSNLVFLIVAFGLFIGAGEEISWGQRVFGFKTPEAIARINVQGEFNLHNLTVVNSKDFQGNWKHGLKRLLEINFLFKISAMLFGIILPFCAYHIKFISGLTTRFKVPVPPISIGLFFFLSWVIHRVIRTSILPADSPIQYVDTAHEIFECTESFILLIISLYFYNKNKILVIGKDIKQII